MSKIVELEIPVNRVEGDLDIYVKIEDGIIKDVKSKGTLYRGFENILLGRDVLDSLVITPRVCGICSVSHLIAATKAIEDAFDISAPAQAIRIRNLSLLSETIQSDMRQHFLMFMADFAHKYYEKSEFYEDALKEYEAFKGNMSKEVLNSTKEILKVVALLGGQWPHTSHVVPGGITSIPSDSDLLDAKRYIDNFKKWYEDIVLTSSIEEFEKVKDYESLLKYCENYPNSQITKFVEISKETNLFEIGKTGYGFLSYGSFDNPENQKEKLTASGFFDGVNIQVFNQSNITEDTTYAFYEDSIALNPFDGETIVSYEKENAYSWAKAPRYNMRAVQTGALAEALVEKDELFTNLYKGFEDCVFVRQFARLLRPIKHIKLMTKMINEVLENSGSELYIEPQNLINGTGCGLTQAARGALGHWIHIEDKKIKKYQIISPTTWNGSPRDKKNQEGPWEKALLNLEVKDNEHLMEMGHVIRSFDPCLVCTVHNMENPEHKVRIKS